MAPEFNRVYVPPGKEEDFEKYLKGIGGNPGKKRPTREEDMAASGIDQDQLKERIRRFSNGEITDERLQATRTCYESFLNELFYWETNGHRPIIIRARDFDTVRALVGEALADLVGLSFHNAPQGAVFIIERFGLESGVRQPIRFAAQLAGRGSNNYNLAYSAMQIMKNRVKSLSSLKEFLGLAQ